MKDKTQKNRKSNKPRIGITIGDYNGIGPEVIVKVLQDKRITNICTPIVYGSGKILTKYKRILSIEDFTYHQYNNNSYIHDQKINVVNCWTEVQELDPGKVTQEAGKCAYLSISRASEDLKSELIDAVVTAPINKANIQSEDFKHAGHTEYYQENFASGRDTLMTLCSGDLRVGVVTGHIPIKDVAASITKEAVSSKLNVMIESLKKDFGIIKPKVAVMGLNPHAGEDGLLGDEEINVISPVIKEFKKRGNLVFGPFPADGFFGTMSFKNYDGVLCMYHDQGLIPFKLHSFESGVNYTAGLDIVRTSPDHGTAYNIAGRGVADETSFREALMQAVDIVKVRSGEIENQIRPNARQLLQDRKDQIKNQKMVLDGNAGGEEEFDLSELEAGERKEAQVTQQQKMLENKAKNQGGGKFQHKQKREHWKPRKNGNFNKGEHRPQNERDKPQQNKND
ncbi:4-hydroxythreonine-4-phosphate dehydrogenase PdxA [Flammeovirga agarivorans]|uniref:4-hydroxythreonine-4-phosphate dehydrogenase PdxA n=1 Tax=Flammeovirga agarivorans TaxID=2726742 RepID=A0A7X8SLV1_9BACT|nr:4-hydroxythreonine-4-phosphate dehydrogenase PdxA [Flammeovirga agarivorans]NLR92543.1 4-hydroxythreonine-4-phosphate dehydrogenase PdxA [Flammeovirga agarivorans]